MYILITITSRYVSRASSFVASIALLFCASIGQVVYADALGRPDMRAPIGVMGDHGHKKGELMLSYRYGRMEMDRNRLGSDNLSIAKVHQNYLIAPLEMTMEMHIFGAMYGLGNNMTLMAMVPYIDKSMDHVARNGTRFITRARGLGDIKLSAMYKLYSKETGDASHHRLGVELGLSLPTGDTNKKDDTPLSMGRRVQLPYPMQLGSGTYDPIMGISYASFHPQWSWGGQFKTTQRLGKNDEGYRLGDEYQATTWAAYRHSDYLSAALRISGKSWNNYHGQDKSIALLAPPAITDQSGNRIPLVPTAYAHLRGGERADLGISINFLQPHGMFKGHRLTTELLVPFYQHLDGPQLEVDYTYTLGWQIAF